MDKEIIIKTENKTPREIIKEVVDIVKTCSICTEDETGSSWCHTCKNMDHFRLNCRLQQMAEKFFKKLAKQFFKKPETFFGIFYSYQYTDSYGYFIILSVVDKE